MTDPTRKHKDRAIAFLAKGKLKEALAELNEVVRASPHDLMTRQRRAEVLGRLGQASEAISELQHIAGRYAVDGQLLKAIAINKIILQLQPGHTQTQKVLADLYSKRTGAGTSRPMVMPLEMAPVKADKHTLGGEYDKFAFPMAVTDPAETSGGTRMFDFDPGDAPIEEVSDSDIELVADLAESLEKPTKISPADLPQPPLFSDLPRAAFVAVLEGMDVKAVPAGEDIVKEGEVGLSMFAIVQGKVDVIRSVSGKRTKVAEMLEGDFFGEIALVSETPRLATVAAKTDTVLLEFTKEHLKSIVVEHAAVGKVIERFHQRRLLENVLRSSPVFEPLSDAQRNALADEFRVRPVKKGEVLLTQGEPGDALYMLLRGRCVASDDIPGLEPSDYPEMREGDLFGEISLLLGRPTTATVRATEPSVVLKLTRAAFKEYVLAVPQVRDLVVNLGRERWNRTAFRMAKLQGDKRV